MIWNKNKNVTICQNPSKICGICQKLSKNDQFFDLFRPLFDKKWKKLPWFFPQSFYEWLWLFKHLLAMHLLNYQLFLFLDIQTVNAVQLTQIFNFGSTHFWALFHFEWLNFVPRLEFVSKFWIFWNFDAKIEVTVWKGSLIAAYFWLIFTHPLCTTQS